MCSQFTWDCQEQRGFDFVAAHFACEQNPWSPICPSGYVNFGSAQNLLAQEWLPALLQDCESPWAHGQDLMKYQAFTGMESCRQSVADYLSDLTGEPGPQSPTAAHIIMGNGLISLLEAVALAVLDPADTVLVTAPVFPGLVTALQLRLQRSVALLPAFSDEGWRPSPQRLDERLSQQAVSGERVRAVVLCSPGNPVGYVLSADTIREFSQVAARHDCVLIVDEVYASSVFGDTPFFSAVALAEPHVIVLGGLSKDFGVAGFATGWACIRDPAIRRGVAAQSHFYRLPTAAQQLTEHILQPATRRTFLDGHRRRLQAAAGTAIRFLHAHDIIVGDVTAGLCLWLDLRGELRTATADGELELYRFLLEEHRVHVSPGSGFHLREHGYFRLCFTQPEATLQEGLQRLVAGLTAFRSKTGSRAPVSEQPYSVRLADAR